MATGIPVVITPVGGIPDIVIDGETGLLVPVNDPASVARAVTRLRNSPELRHKLVQQGRAHVEENFDGEKNNERLMSIIKDLIDVRVRSTANSLAGSASRDF